MEIGAFEAKTHFSHLLEQVERGEHIVITKHGRPVAKLVPIDGKSLEQRKSAIVRIKVFCEQNTLGGLNWKELRDKGRK